MRVREILNHVEHRPWKMPEGSWKFYQEWNKAIFLHWEVDKSELKKFVPNDLEIDLIKGKPWVSLVAFTMEKTRPKNLPYFPPISNFDEINIRTYVKYNGKKGVYFLSIEGGKKLSCLIARKLSALPYRHSPMLRHSDQFESSNVAKKDHFLLKYKIGKSLNKDMELDRWLTERYALFQDSTRHINEFEIHHVEWPKSEIDLMEVRIDYPRFYKLLEGTPHLSHFSEGVEVLAWGKQSYPKEKL